MILVDFLVKNCSQLLTLYGEAPRRGAALSDLGIIEKGWIGSRQGKIVFVGDEALFREKAKLTEEAVEIDATGKIVTPGFVDSHTHLPFAGDRSEEFKMKLDGISYLELQRKGMGIKATVKATREIPLQDLVSVCQKRLDEMVRGGATTIEAKSGYGLDEAGELKQLEALKVLKEIHPVDIVSTYMGGHDVPPGEKKEEYLDALISHHIPLVASLKRARFFDAFLEEGIFTPEEIRRMLEAARNSGFELKLHADEFTDQGGAALAASLGCVSAEHLLKISDSGITALAASSTVAVVLPGVYFFLRTRSSAPVRKMIDSGVAVALGTDFNPGSSMIHRMLFALRLGVFLSEFRMEEAIAASTINGACALGVQDSVGSLAPGKKMDLLVFDVPHYRELFYSPSLDPLEMVVKEGEILLKNGELLY